MKMSKRSGTFVTLRDIIDEVGGDVVRFIMRDAAERPNALDFDFAKVYGEVEGTTAFSMSNMPMHAAVRCSGRR